MLQWRQALQSVLTEDLGEKTCPSIQIVPELGRRVPKVTCNAQILILSRYPETTLVPVLHE